MVQEPITRMIPALSTAIHWSTLLWYGVSHARYARCASARNIIAAATSLEVAVVELDAFAGDMFDAVTDSYAYLNAGASS